MVDETFTTNGPIQVDAQLYICKNFLKRPKAEIPKQRYKQSLVRLLDKILRWKYKQSISKKPKAIETGSHIYRLVPCETLYWAQR